MSSLLTTGDLVARTKRIDGAEPFFEEFGPAFDAAARSVWKLETRQEYREPGNPSWEFLDRGDLEAAIRTASEARKEDLELYNDLKQRGVVFTRIRPVLFPLTDYLRWELACYDFNSHHGEKIFFLDGPATADIFSTRAQHDFMLFDERVAFVHDYDSSGLLTGGWKLEDTEGVQALGDLYQELLVRATPYCQFLAAHQH